MTTAIGAVLTEHIVAGRLQDHKPVGTTLHYPSNTTELDALVAMPGSEMVLLLAEQIASIAAAAEGPIDAIGVAVPGIVRRGIVEDSPNLVQLKGMNMAQDLAWALASKGVQAPVHVANDADAIAAGMAATREHLDRLTRLDDKLLSLVIVLSIDKLQQCAEGTLGVTGATLHAQAAGADMYASIDELFDKLLIQLRKHREKVSDKHQREGREERLFG